MYFYEKATCVLSIGLHPSPSVRFMLATYSFEQHDIGHNYTALAHEGKVVFSESLYSLDEQALKGHRNINVLVLPFCKVFVAMFLSTALNGVRTIWFLFEVMIYALDMHREMCC